MVSPSHLRGVTNTERKVMYEKNMLKIHENQLKLSQANYKLSQSNYDILKIMIDRNAREITYIKRLLLSVTGILFIYFLAELIGKLS
jgi:hypothetical protein